MQVTNLEEQELLSEKLHKGLSSFLVVSALRSQEVDPSDYLEVQSQLIPKVAAKVKTDLLFCVLTNFFDLLRVLQLIQFKAGHQVNQVVVGVQNYLLILKK